MTQRDSLLMRLYTYIYVARLVSVPTVVLNLDSLLRSKVSPLVLVTKFLCNLSMNLLQERQPNK